MSAAPRCALDLLAVLLGPAVRNLARQQFRRRLDGGQEVVEVVRDATREPAHGLQTLRPPQRLLQLRLAQLVVPLFGDVADETEQSARRVVGRAQQREPEPYEPVGALGVAHPQRGLEDLIALQLAQPVELGPGVGAVVGMYELEQPLRRVQLADAMSEEYLAVEDLAVPFLDVQERDRIGRIAEHRLEARLRGPELGLDPALLVDRGVEGAVLGLQHIDREVATDDRPRDQRCHEGQQQSGDEGHRRQPRPAERGSAAGAGDEQLELLAAEHHTVVPPRESGRRADVAQHDRARAGGHGRGGRRGARCGAGDERERRPETRGLREADLEKDRAVPRREARREPEVVRGTGVAVRDERGASIGAERSDRVAREQRRIADRRDDPVAAADALHERDARKTRARLDVGSEDTHEPARVTAGCGHDARGRREHLVGRRRELLHREQRHVGRPLDALAVQARHDVASHRERADRQDEADRRDRDTRPDDAPRAGDLVMTFAGCAVLPPPRQGDGARDDGDEHEPQDPRRAVVTAGPGRSEVRIPQSGGGRDLPGSRLHRKPDCFRGRRASGLSGGGRASDCRTTRHAAGTASSVRSIKARCRNPFKFNSPGA